MIALKLFSQDDTAEELTAFFETTYAPAHPELERLTLKDYRGQIVKLSEWLKRPALLSDLVDERVSRFLTELLEVRSSATVLKARSTILAMWRYAWLKSKLDQPPRDVFKPSPHKRAPRAWSVDQIGEILAAFKQAPVIKKRRDGQLVLWDDRHWTALILTIYDTSLRITALMKSKRTDLDLLHGILTTDAAIQKEDADGVHELHAGTLAAISRLPEPKRELLFDFPLKMRQIWKKYADILKAAGLPHGSRDKFHKIRRTSYTYTYALMGPEEATRHAGHSGDLSQYYLDTSLCRRVAKKASPANVIPRPSSAPQPVAGG